MTSSRKKWLKLANAHINKRRIHRHKDTEIHNLFKKNWFTQTNTHMHSPTNRHTNSHTERGYPIRKHGQIHTQIQKLGVGEIDTRTHKIGTLNIRKAKISTKVTHTPSRAHIPEHTIHYSPRRLSRPKKNWYTYRDIHKYARMMLTSTAAQTQTRSDIIRLDH